ncbi:hypothetical protein B0H14DRAFT_2624508 [Mycena olivaceomarginata]|nr:hypothetical protein B0H14DRAFT_2624508 [Mycena olivaceomarginata]
MAAPKKFSAFLGRGNVKLPFSASSASSNYSSNYEEVDSPQTQNRHAPSDSALVLTSGTTGLSVNPAGPYVDQGRCLTDEERQIAARTLWQEVPQSNEDRFFCDFVLRVIGNSDSAICEYHLSSPVLLVRRIEWRVGSKPFRLTAADDTLWLPSHHQLELTLDYNVPTKNLVDLFTGTPERTAVTSELVSQVLAVLYKLRTDEQNINYLEYQRQYLTGLSSIQLKMMRALNQIGKVISDLSRRRNLHPTADQESESRGFGLIMSLWTMEAYRRAIDSGHVDVGYYGRVNPLRVALREAIYPALIPNYMEPEYAVYVLTANPIPHRHWVVWLAEFSISAGYTESGRNNQKMLIFSCFFHDGG